MHMQRSRQELSRLAPDICTNMCVAQQDSNQSFSQDVSTLHTDFGLNSHLALTPVICVKVSTSWLHVSTSSYTGMKKPQYLSGSVNAAVTAQHESNIRGKKSGDVGISIIRCS